MTIVTRALIGALAVALAMPSWAHAQSVEAEVLFREGKKLIAEGKIAQGCDKLDASARIESTPGTLLNLADCREKNGQTATAWAAFQKAASAAKLAGDSERAGEAHRREKLLEAQLSYLTINTLAAMKLPDLSIRRNGTSVDTALWNQALPVDPGDYEIAGEAAGHERWAKKIHVDPGGAKVVVEVPALATKSGEREPTVVPDKPIETHRAEQPVQVTTPPPAEPVAVGKPSSPGTFTSQRKLALAIGAVGVVALGVGTYFGLHGNDLESQSDKLCAGTACTDPKAVDLNDQARSAALKANIALVGGGAAIAGAVVLWLVGAPKVAHEGVTLAPIAGDHGVGLALCGAL
jgi:hypothetical protein